jgi:hypothetical protein
MVTFLAQQQADGRSVIGMARPLRIEVAGGWYPARFCLLTPNRLLKKAC